PPAAWANSRALWSQFRRCSQLVSAASRLICASRCSANALSSAALSIVDLLERLNVFQVSASSGCPLHGNEALLINDVNWGSVYLEVCAITPEVTEIEWLSDK